MTYCIFDIESVRDRTLTAPSPKRCNAPLLHEPGEPEVHCLAHVGAGACSCCGAPPQDPFLPPPFHRVVSLGYALVSDEYVIQSLGVETAFGEEQECELIRSFIGLLETVDPTIVTFAGRQFDVPVLVARAFKYGIPFPWYYEQRRSLAASPRYRYGLKHIDLMEQLSDYGSSPKSQMGTYAKMMGLPGKVESGSVGGGRLDGSSVEKLYEAGEYEAIADYNACDVIQETGLLFRYLLLRGQMSLEEYRLAARSLVRQIMNNHRLYALRTGGSVMKDGVSVPFGINLPALYLEKAGEAEAREALRKEAGNEQG